jgi:hypothetical protein
LICDSLKLVLALVLAGFVVKKVIAALFNLRSPFFPGVVHAIPGWVSLFGIVLSIDKFLAARTMFGVALMMIMLIRVLS